MDGIQFFSLLATIIIAAAAIGGLIMAQIRALDRHFELRFSELDQRISELSQRFAGLEQRFAELETRVSALETRVSALETHVSALGARVSDLSERVSRIEGLLQGMFARAGSADDN